MEAPLTSLENVKLVVRKLVERRWPAAIGAFEMTLGQLTEWPADWRNVPPSAWRAEDLLRQAVSRGYCSPQTVPADLPPWMHFATLLAGVARHFQSCEKRPDDPEIIAVYNELGSAMNLPATVLDAGEKAAVELVRLASGGSPDAKAPAKRYAVYEGERRHMLATDHGLAKYRARRDKYELYVDDFRSQILVRGKPVRSLLAGETKTFLLLKCLLRRVGSHWLHEELFRELGMELPGQEDLMRVGQNESRILLHRMLASIRTALGKHISERKVRKWFDSAAPGRVVIAAGLKSCLIERI